MKVTSIMFLVVVVLSCARANAKDGMKPDCVGYASIDAEGRIQLNLLSSEQTHGGAMLVLDKGHPLFEEMRTHLGRLRVGKWKCVKSLPEMTNSDKDSGARTDSEPPSNDARVPAKNPGR